MILISHKTKLKFMNGNSQIRIAIVDDNSLILNSINAMLTIWQFNVSLQAINGKDFLEKLTADNVPDICILDLNMPEMNGYETIKALKEKWPAVKTIIYSMEFDGFNTNYMHEAAAM